MGLLNLHRESSTISMDNTVKLMELKLLLLPLLLICRQYPVCCLPRKNLAATGTNIRQVEEVPL